MTPMPTSLWMTAIAIPMNVANRVVRVARRADALAGRAKNPIIGAKIQNLEIPAIAKPSLVSKARAKVVIPAVKVNLQGKNQAAASRFVVASPAAANPAAVSPLPVVLLGVALLAVVQAAAVVLAAGVAQLVAVVQAAVANAPINVRRPTPQA